MHKSKIMIATFLNLTMKFGSKSLQIDGLSHSELSFQLSFCAMCISNMNHSGKYKHKCTHLHSERSHPIDVVDGVLSLPFFPLFLSCIQHICPRTSSARILIHNHNWRGARSAAVSEKNK